ncbi:hypothetical protein PGH12_12590 [Chryseobacterium wangxinyae]|uniref:hypothetical protein n=1 Tax=Chryseobacterium sp. CY350 TaxID=2997336 RepID=UPI00227078D8|nr:hypothetical protein [Chryseobacterium sp. CY350]MCY0976093.1 hypothetical protein [Chryseobacterium sp. CY350]WBZ94307.1 hypothetical protein PGH12_12590 [Chryseobacterium sp. CY350]
MGSWKYEIIHDYNATKLINEFREENLKLKNSRGMDDDETDCIIYAEKDDHTISLGRVLLIKMSDTMIKYYHEYKDPNYLPKYWAKYIYDENKNNKTFQFKEEEISDAFLDSINLQTKLMNISGIELQNYFKKITENISDDFRKDEKFSREQWDPTLKSDQYLFSKPELAINYFVKKCDSLKHGLTKFRNQLELIKSFKIIGKEFKIETIEDIIKGIDEKIKGIENFKKWLVESRDNIKLDIAYFCGIYNGLVEFFAGFIDIAILAINIVISDLLGGETNLEFLEIREGVEEMLSKIIQDPGKVFNDIIEAVKNYKYSRYDDPKLNQYQIQYNEGEDTILAINIVITIITIIKAIVKLTKLLPKFVKWIESVLARNGKGADKVKKALRNSKRTELFSKIKGKPISKKLLKELQDDFKKTGGDLVYDENSFEYIASREKIYNEEIEALTFNEELIYLNKNVTTSAVYEELIHAEQFRSGKYNTWVNKYNNIIAENLMEKEAAEELLENSIKWKLPKEEIKLIEERLGYFKNELKRLDYDN